MSLISVRSLFINIPTTYTNCNCMYNYVYMYLSTLLRNFTNTFDKQYNNLNIYNKPCYAIKINSRRILDLGGRQNSSQRINEAPGYWPAFGNC